MFLMFRCVIFIILTYFFIIIGVVNAQRAQRGQRLRLCSIVNVPNAVVRFKHNYKIMRINCVPGFSLQGGNIVGCENGKWNSEISVCAKDGCLKPETPLNGLVMQTRYKANLYCKDNYKLIGGRVTYCNGTHWDRPLGKCQETNDKIQLGCDFESDDLCGWSHDETHNFDWKRIMGANIYQQFRTGPQHDHTTFTANSGHYMLMESFDQSPYSFARLVSPVYSKAITNMYGCFQFFYFMYGAAVGSLNVYVKPASVDMEQMLQEPGYKHFGISGNQKNVWREGLFIIKQLKEDFQIVIEGIAGVNHLSDIAIDDVKLMEYSECVALTSNGITKSPEYTDYAIFDVQSCEGRCSETTSSNFGVTNKKGVFYKSCDCHEECEALNTCCPNYRSTCEFGNNADQTTTEALGSVTFLPYLVENTHFVRTTSSSSTPFNIPQTKSTPSTITTTITTTTATTAAINSFTSAMNPIARLSTILDIGKYSRPSTQNEIVIPEDKVVLTTAATTAVIITEIPKTFPVLRRTTLQPVIYEHNTKIVTFTPAQTMVSSHGTRRNYPNFTESTQLNSTTENIFFLRKNKFITWKIPKYKAIKQNDTGSGSVVLHFSLIVITVLIFILAIKHHKLIKKFKQRHIDRFLKEANEDSTVLIYNQNNEL